METQQIILNGIEAQSFYESIRQIIRSEILSILNPKEVHVHMDIDQASRFTGISKSKIYKLTSQKRIPHIKQGSKLLFHREQVTAWLQSSQQEVFIK